MIDENLQVADTVSDEFVNEVLFLSMEEFMDFGKAYRIALARYKEMFLSGRTSVSSLRFPIGYSDIGQSDTLTPVTVTLFGCKKGSYIVLKIIG